MNISFVSDTVYPYFKGGKEKRLYELSTRLARMGHDVHIYTMHWWPEPAKTHIEDGVTWHALCTKYELYKGDRRSIKEGILFGLACFKLFRVRFDVLDVDHMPFFPIFSCWLVCLLRLRRKKMFGTWHEALTRQDWTDYMGFAGNIAAVIERISIRLPHHVTSGSAHTQQLIIKKLHRKKNIHTITSGVDLKLIKKLKPINKKVDVLYAGRFVKDKNIDKLIHAISILSVIDPGICCIIIGHGNEKLNLQRLVKDLRMERNIFILNTLSTSDEVYRYMKAARVFCLPSVREGFGIVAIEALACNTPVITTDSPSNGSRLLIKDDENGAIVRLNSKNLAAAILSWLNRRNPINFINHVEEYDWDVLARKQAEVYKS